MITNGQRANATNFNAAFVSRTDDTSTLGVLELANADAASGDTITNTQREMNALWSFLGGLINQVKDYVPTWVSNNFGAADNDVKTKIEAIDAAFADSESFDKRAGRTAIGNDVQSIAVVFSSVWADALYVVTFAITNTTEGVNAIFLQGVITARSAAGFTVSFNAKTDSANYVLEYRIEKAV